MMNRLVTTGIAFAMALVMWSNANAGVIKGAVTVKKAKDAQDVVVYIDAVPGKTFPAPKAHVKINQKNMVFIPHVLPVQVGTTVEFLNNDQVLHNVFTPSKAADRFNLGTWGKGEGRSYTFEKEGSAVLLCNVHPEMEGYVVVVPTPYYAVTDADGRFAIEGVPAGTYTLKVWTKGKAHAEPVTVTVPATGVAETAFTLK